LINPENIESDIARYETWRDEARTRLEELSRPGLGHNNPPAPSRDFPRLSGRRANISERDDYETRRGLCRENETACNLVANGHDVEQSPNIAGRKNPDYLIDREIFDNYAPITEKALNIWDYVARKVNEHQAKSIILNLRDTSVTKEEITKIFIEAPVEGLNNLWIIDRQGQIYYVFGWINKKEDQ
jgi:hypothetical protein